MFEEKNRLRYLYRSVPLSLLIHHGDNNIVVKGWIEGELGIQLGVGGPETLPVTTTIADGTANQDFLTGTSSNDLIRGLAGIINQRYRSRFLFNELR